VTAVPEVRDAYGQAIVATLQGQDAAEALRLAKLEIDRILEREQ